VGDDGWIPALPVSALQEGRGVRATVAGTEIVLVRSGDDVFAVAGRCTHQGAPLATGVVKLAGSVRTITCPVHGSTFDILDGTVVRPPAMRPLAAYETRIAADTVEVRPRTDPGGRSV
jgi:nitrite reductase/ring-hydroxylating ferredoxin subunit